MRIAVLGTGLVGKLPQHCGLLPIGASGNACKQLRGVIGTSNFNSRVAR
jgi:hypothetical protein